MVALGPEVGGTASLIGLDGNFLQKGLEGVACSGACIDGLDHGEGLVDEGVFLLRADVVAGLDLHGTLLLCHDEREGASCGVPQLDGTVTAARGENLREGQVRDVEDGIVVRGLDDARWFDGPWRVRVVQRTQVFLQVPDQNIGALLFQHVDIRVEIRETLVARRTHEVRLLLLLALLLLLLLL